MACFDKGVESVLKKTKCSGEFKACYQEWIKRSRHTVVAYAEKIFCDHCQAHEALWTEGDFKRWVLSKNQWTIYFELRGVTYNIPLNLLSLFGIKL